MAVGQGNNLVTPLQLTNAYATFANGGTVLAPNVAKQLTAADGTVLRSWEPRQVGSVDISPEIRGPLLNGLLGAVSLAGPEGDRGTAYDAFHSIAKGGIDFALDEFPIAGKTGTAEVQGKADSAWFVGFGPVKPQEPPRYVFSVLLEESGFGGRLAAPVAAFVLNDLLFNDIKPLAVERSIAGLPRRAAIPTAFTTDNRRSTTRASRRTTTTTTLAPSSTTTDDDPRRPAPRRTTRRKLTVPAAARQSAPVGVHRRDRVRALTRAAPSRPRRTVALHRSVVDHRQRSDHRARHADDLQRDPQQSDLARDLLRRAPRCGHRDRHRRDGCRCRVRLSQVA